MRGLLRPLQQLLRTSFRDLAPLVAVVAFFQLIVIGGHFPDIGRALVGFAFVAAGLALFVKGLELGLFPLGEAMAVALARKAKLLLLLAFAFALGFATTIAEPALIAVAGEAASAASRSGVIDDDAGIRDRYAMELRLTIALSVGFALVIGVIRIVKGWPIHAVIIAGYLLISVLTLFAPPEIVGIAFDSGGITTSTVTVPLVAALGIGLAQSIRGRNPLLDGFGLIAFASLTPMAFVMLFGILRGGG